MVARIVECHLKLEKKSELNKTLRNEVFLLVEQPGFVDLIGLWHGDNQERSLAITFWNTRQDAERYHQEHHQRVVELIRPFLNTEPKVELCDVDAFLSHKIGAGRVMKH